MPDSSPTTIVFITGACLGKECWDEWIKYFNSKGFNCMAPPWPHKDAPPEELRNRHPEDPIALNRLTALTDYFAAIIKDLPEQPILIGHSLGGLVVQLLLQRGLVRSAIAIHSFPPFGVSSFRFSFLKSLWDAMAFFSPSQKTYLINFKKWKYVMANGMGCEQQKDLYYKYAVPESKMIIRDTFKCLATINFKKAHNPLLLISGGRDKIISPGLSYANYKNYKVNDSITDIKNFRNHNHLVFDDPEWRRTADFILNWLYKVKIIGHVK